MPQPNFTSLIWFGNSPLPAGQGLSAWIPLSDYTSWFPQDFNVDGGNRQIGTEQVLYRAKGVYTYDDFDGKVIAVPMSYYEGPGTPLGAAKAQLSQAGEQYLSFDNKVTAALAKLKGFGVPKLRRKFQPYWWDLTLEFYLKEPWFRDLASTAIAAQTLVAQPQSAPAARPLAGGALAVGTYQLYYTFVTASGETAASPLSAPIALSGGNLQISVDAVILPTYATAVKWYLAAGSPTTGFTVQNANGNAFTLNTAGNSVMPPASTPATQLAIAYAGSVFAEPVFTVTIPAMVALPAAGPPRPVRAQMVRTAIISRRGGSRAAGARLVASYDGPWKASMQAGYAGTTALSIANTMSGESITVSFPGGLDPLQAWTITVDAGAMTAKDQNGKSYDIAGTAFPMLYPPAGQSNPLTFSIVQAGPPTPLVTLAGSYQNRWEI
jgi:hypothetical protein